MNNKTITINLSKKEGFIKFRRVGKYKHGLFELERIEVNTKYLREGRGTILFEKMLRRIDGFRKLFCTTHASNKEAHEFYENMGMKMEAVLPNHYYDGESELVYSLYSVNPIK